MHSVASLGEVPRGITGAVVANELLDNMAFRLVERDDSVGTGWVEIWVSRDARPEELRVPVPAELAHRLAMAAPDAPNGARIPLQTEAGQWVADALGHIESGLVVVFDYADTTPSMARRPWSDWLRTYRNHRRGGHPLEDPGTQDITVEVALDQLPPGASVTTQAHWLGRWGIDERIDAAKELWSEGAGIGDLAVMRARSVPLEAEALCDLDGLGAFAVAEWHVGGHRGSTR